MRDTILAPAAAIAQQNSELSDAGLRHLLRATLARRHATPPQVGANTPPEEVRRRDDAWAREIRRVRAALDRSVPYGAPAVPVALHPDRDRATDSARPMTPP